MANDLAAFPGKTVTDLLSASRELHFTHLSFTDLHRTDLLCSIPDFISLYFADLDFAILNLRSLKCLDAQTLLPTTLHCANARQSKTVYDIVFFIGTQSINSTLDSKDVRSKRPILMLSTAFR